MNRIILLILHCLSLILLGFGWVKDMLQIDITTHLFIALNLFNEKRSVLSTLKSLWQTANYWPFFLIFIFGIVVPIVKSGVVFYLLITKQPQQKWYAFVSAISKWAMADVFAISIFVAFLGARAMENTKAILEPGFYFFAGYVVLGGIIVTLLGKLLKKGLTFNA